MEATALKVPHHGAAGAADPSFFRAVSPGVSVVSVGEDNEYGHPSESALGKLKALGSKIFRTDRDGTVKILTDGQRVEVVTDG
ncbi:MAG: hypothetical protein ACYC1U_04235 [Candidatus Aquicultorales bacterium]